MHYSLNASMTKYSLIILGVILSETLPVLSTPIPSASSTVARDAVVGFGLGTVLSLVVAVGTLAVDAALRLFIYNKAIDHYYAGAKKWEVEKLMMKEGKRWLDEGPSRSESENHQ
jgi:hypothetical protein